MAFISIPTLKAPITYTITYDKMIEYDGFTRPQSFTSVNSVDIDKELEKLKANKDISNIQIYTISRRTVV